MVLEIGPAAFLASALLMVIAGCGSATPAPSQPSPEPTIPSDPAPVTPTGLDYSAVQIAADNTAIDNLAVMIGDETGVLFAYEKGSFRTNDILRLASATKLITGLAVWSLAEQGALSLADTPGDVIAFWTDAPSDPRSQVTMEQLLAFTSGFNNRPAAPGCQGDGLYTLQECVRDSYDSGIDTAPGGAFSYGPEHMQIAALLVLEKTGDELRDVMHEQLFDPNVLSDAMGFEPLLGDNPRYSGNLMGTADDYALLLSALLRGDIASDLEAFLTDRTAQATIAYRPETVTENPVDWHYGFGFWKECDAPTYTPACDAANVISSPGAFGFTPWVDFGRGYWGIIAMEEALTFTVRPAGISVALEQEIQALLEAQLDG